MKTVLKAAVLGASAILVFLLDLTPLQLVPEAHAVAGVRRRTARRTAVVVGSAASAEAAAATSAASAQTAAAQQEAAAAQQQAAAAEQEAAAARAEAEAAQQQAAAAQAAAAVPPLPPPAPLPIGTVVAALPAGCTATPVGGVEYYYCGSNYYRAAFQGTQVVYVTAQP
jgi:hypothetical protein